MVKREILRQKTNSKNKVEKETARVTHVVIAQVVRVVLELRAYPQTHQILHIKLL